GPGAVAGLHRDRGRADATGARRAVPSRRLDAAGDPPRRRRGDPGRGRRPDAGDPGAQPWVRRDRSIQFLTVTRSGPELVPSTTHWNGAGTALKVAGHKLFRPTEHNGLNNNVGGVAIARYSGRRDAAIDSAGGRPKVLRTAPRAARREPDRAG